MRADYWGKDTLYQAFKSSERVLTIHSRVWRELSIQNPSGKLYLRDEHKLFYDRTVNAAQDPAIPGVIITGHEGIGKSYLTFARVPS